MTSSLENLSGIGPATLNKLHHLGIFCPKDLLYHFPSRYIDFSQYLPISRVVSDQTITVTGTITAFRNIYTRSRRQIQKATLTDSTGSIDLVWFNQPYISKSIRPGISLAFAGTVTDYQGRNTIFSPIYGDYHTGKIIAVYPETKGLSSSWFRKYLGLHTDLLLTDITDPLPSDILAKYNLINLITALKTVHQPQNLKKLEASRLRLGLNEILSLLAKSHLSRLAADNLRVKFIFKQNSAINQHLQKLINSLPFHLTSTQTRAWKQIKKDLLSHRPTNRLLEGDVGSGKTIIAILACYLSRLNHSLSLVIAPTEILARQHYRTFRQILKIPIKLLTAKTKIKSLPPNAIVIATHAAIYHKSIFAGKVGLLIVDEQHKFGVNQRTFLSDPLHPPHCLTMTATPIPRTVSLTLLGNLNITHLDTVPFGRLPVKTFFVPRHKRNDCYLWLKKHLSNSLRQAFIVCPFIEPSETLSSVSSAKLEYDRLTAIFSEFKLGLIHGKTSSADRQLIMDDFRHHRLQILVTTPIIEVGIDYPDATTIIIQSADRFGLAQLHQLRGRVGRGPQQSYCYLFSDSNDNNTIARLQFFQQTADGRKIAEYDLKTRGPGEAFSVIQHGFPSLKMASLSDYQLISLGQKVIGDLSAANYDLNCLLTTPSPDLRLQTN